MHFFYFTITVDFLTKDYLIVALSLDAVPAVFPGRRFALGLPGAGADLPGADFPN